jgi:ribonuclease J
MDQRGLMKFIIHRGAKQIGGSCVELRSDSGVRLILDAGMPLAQPDRREWPRGTMVRQTEALRKEGVLPDVGGFYRGSDPEVLGLVISHAHMDHYGLAHHVHPEVPVFGSRGTLAMLKASRLFVPDT